jgi:hypothetical protein
MTEEALREEVARQTRLLGEVPSRAVEAILTDGASPHAVPATPAVAGPVRSADEETPHAGQS